MKIGWPELAGVKDVFYEDDLREQGIGVVKLYGDFEAFWTLNPEQRRLRELEGEYFYKFPGGENVPDLRFRVRALLERIARLYNDRTVLVITHDRTLLAIRAEIENWDIDEYIKWSTNSNLINCSVSIYAKPFNRLEDSELMSVVYNKKLYN